MKVEQEKVKVGKKTGKDSPPDTCGTYTDKVGCYVPILTRCPACALHRSKGER